MATESPTSHTHTLTYNGEIGVSTFSRLFFIRSLFIFVGNEAMPKISDEFEFWPDRTTELAVLERLSP